MTPDDQSRFSLPPRVIVVVLGLLLSARLAAAVGVFDNGDDGVPFFEPLPASDPPPAMPLASTAVPAQSSGLALLQAIQASFRQVAAAALPVVVKIDTTVPAGSARRFGRSPQRPPEFGQPGGTGSGIIVSNTGRLYHVLTNNHVIANTDSIAVTLDDGRDFSAQLVGRDPRQDIAVVSFRGPRGCASPASVIRASSWWATWCWRWAARSVSSPP